MSKPSWVVNEIKYNRAVTATKNSGSEKEIKALYVSYGGLLGDVTVEAEVTPEVDTTETISEVEEIETLPEATEEVVEKKTRKTKKTK